MSAFVCIRWPKMGRMSVVVVVVVVLQDSASVLRPGDGTVAAVLRRELT